MKFILGLGLLISVSAFANEDWSHTFMGYGRGGSTGSASSSAYRQCESRAQQYGAHCKSQKGSFTWSVRHPSCSKYDPLFKDVYCYQQATYVCRIPQFEGSFEIEEVVGNHNKVAEPGEELAITPLLTNLKSKTIKVATAKIEVIEGKEYVELLTKELAFDEMGPGEGSISSTPVQLKILSTAPCGTSATLKYVISGGVGATLVQNIKIGRFNGVPLTAKVESPIEVGDQGGTAVLPISLATSTPKAAPKQVKLKFQVAVIGTKQVKVKLISPDAKQSVIYNGKVRNKLSYDKDLSAPYAKVAAIGEWKLEVVVTGKANEGSLQTAELKIVPNSYLCE